MHMMETHQFSTSFTIFHSEDKNARSDEFIQPVKVQALFKNYSFQ